MRRQHRASGTMRLGLAVALLLAACDPAEPTGSTDPRMSSTIPVTQMDVVCDSLPARAVVTDQELAFVGTVVETSAEENTGAWYQRFLADDGKIDSDEESQEQGLTDAQGEHEGDPEIWPWTTFEVDAWFTHDAGEQISIWTPGLDLNIGQTWLISGAAFGTPEGLGDHMDQSGMATVCASRLYDEETAGQWDQWFGGSVVPGGMKPEGDPDPVDVETIEGGRTLWNQSRPDAYTVRMRVWTGADGHRGSDCDASGLLRIVVIGKVVDEAVNIEQGCRLDPMIDVYTIDDLFDLAITASGAADESGYEIDPIYGYPRHFYGYDRSVELEGHVESLTPNVSYALVGEEVEQDLHSMRRRWESSAIASYTFVVERLCFCEFWGPSVVTVVDGETTSVVFEGESLSGEELDPSFLAYIPDTIDELFDLIESESRRADLVVAGFDQELGYPTDLYIDSIANAVDDELTIFVSGFEEGRP